MPPASERPLDRTAEDVMFRVLLVDWPHLIDRLGWFEDKNWVSVQNRDGSVVSLEATVEDIIHLLAGGGHVMDRAERWAASFGFGGTGTVRLRLASFDAASVTHFLELQERALRDEAACFEVP
jgi:hypothetical protein